MGVNVGPGVADGIGVGVGSGVEVGVGAAGGVAVAGVNGVWVGGGSVAAKGVSGAGVGRACPGVGLGRESQAVENSIARSNGTISRQTLISISNATSNDETECWKLYHC